VRYTPEDASRTEFEFLVRVCNAAIEAGADRISFADTLGILQPHTCSNASRRCAPAGALQDRPALPQRLRPGAGKYTGGVRGGADCIHTTVNGMGERTGIPDLSETPW
jgi:2-isopropylmalate synthase